MTGGQGTPVTGIQDAEAALLRQISPQPQEFPSERQVRSAMAELIGTPYWAVV